jgi:hypothetical protein
MRGERNYRLGAVKLTEDQQYFRQLDEVQRENDELKHRSNRSSGWQRLHLSCSLMRSAISSDDAEEKISGGRCRCEKSSSRRPVVRPAKCFSFTFRPRRMI